MAYSHHERLTAADEAFLDLEGPMTPMHVGAVCLYDLEPLQMAGGGLDFARLLRQTEAALPAVPRFRQRLSTIPLFGRPVWVDDEHFNLRHHVRHTAVPRPGDTRQLKRLAGRILSQSLDRSRPLWEMWFVEGLEGGQFASVIKAHHCMVDGIAGADLLAALMAVDPGKAPRPDRPWLPRPHPSGIELLAGELGRRADLVPGALRAGRDLLIHPRRTLRAAADVAAGLTELAGVRAVSPSPLNVSIGPHRRFDWTRVDLGAMREIGHRLGGTVNDVALAVVTGALRTAWRRQGHDVDRMDCRALVSVSLRAAAERGALGNRVATLLAALPMDETDPARRLQRVAETMRAAKASHQVLGTEIIEELSDWTFASLLVVLARLAVRTHAYTIDVTNVPGPPSPLHLLGAELREVYALTPLVEDQALALALFSYSGGMHWGFNADWDAVPALHELVETVEAELATLRRAATRRITEIRGGRAGRRGTNAGRSARQRRTARH
jgi:WS/DGAT/MGAT family acyltransferase